MRMCYDCGMTRSTSDPAAGKYQSTFETFVARILAVPKDEIKEADAKKLKRPNPRRKKPATK